MEFGYYITISNIYTLAMESKIYNINIYMIKIRNV